MFTHDHVSVRTFARNLCQSMERTIRNRLHQRCVSDECDTFEMTVDIATTVKVSSVKWANKTVVAY